MEMTVDLGLAQIIWLALVDAVNPCTLAVLLLILISILTMNPGKRVRVLYSGLSFSLAVLVMYLFYGIVIIRFFQLVQAITEVKLFLYRFLGGVAIVLGVLNIRDFFRYRPGTVGTEMPLSFRPGVQKLVAKVTGPAGAFVIGLAVTLFLLPCTIGPYIIAGGILSAKELISTIPYLIIYNIVFISPMVAVTLLVYGGMARIKDVVQWKNKYVRHLHFTAGGLLLFLGAGMIAGLF